MQILNDISSINWRFISAASDVTIERTVHNHGTDIGLSRCKSVITYDTAYVRTACYVGIAIAVDDTCIAVQMAYDTTDMIRTADTTAIHTAVIDAGAAKSCTYNGAGMTVSIATAYSCVLNNHILDDCILSISDEGS